MNGENEMLQQASVDYLQQINQNVVSLNTTASAQKEIQERQLVAQESTKDVLDEVKTNSMATVHNQAYMAYGTFQHDVQGLAGFTDEGTRTALSTMHIAGNMAMNDVRGVYGSVSDTSSGVISRLTNMTSSPTVSQGVFGAAFGGFGLTRAPGSMTQQEYEALSQRQVGGFFKSIKDYATMDFGKAASRDLAEQLLDPFASRFMEPYGVSAEKTIEKYGMQMQEVRNFMDRHTSIGSENSKQVMFEGAQAALANPSVMGSQEDVAAKLVEYLKTFAVSVSELSVAFKTSATDMAAALSQLSTATGMNPEQSTRFMKENLAAYQTLGRTGEEALRLTATGANISRALGVEIGRGSEEYRTMYADIVRRAAGDAQYMKLVRQAGGEEVVAERKFQRNEQFMGSSLGLMYAAAEAGGVNIEGASLAEIAMGATRGLTKGGDPLKNLLAITARVDQFPTSSLAQMSQRNLYTQYFRTTQGRDPSESELASLMKFLPETAGISGRDRLEMAKEFLAPQAPISEADINARMAENERIVRESQAKRERTVGAGLREAVGGFFQGAAYNPNAGNFIPYSAPTLPSQAPVPAQTEPAKAGSISQEDWQRAALGQMQAMVGQTSALLDTAKTIADSTR